MRNGILRTTSEVVKGVMSRSVGFCDIQFFDGMLMWVLIFSLTSTPVGWKACPMWICGRTGSQASFVCPATLGEIMLTDVPELTRLGALAWATLTGRGIVGTGRQGEFSLSNSTMTGCSMDSTLMWGLDLASSSFFNFSGQFNEMCPFLWQPKQMSAW